MHHSSKMTKRVSSRLLANLGLERRRSLGAEVARAFGVATAGALVGAAVMLVRELQRAREPHATIVLLSVVQDEPAPAA
jgi:predicted kinase